MLSNNIKKTSYDFVIGITLKKELAIAEFLNEIRGYLPVKSLIVLFFDNSKDLKTLNECQKYVKNNTNILIIYDNKTENLADAYFKLYKYCSNLSTEWIISMNAGWRHHPSDLVKFIKLSKKKIDCIWGYREKNSNKANINRKLISFMGNILSNFLLNLKLKDLTSGFYMIRRKVLKKEIYKLKKFRSKYHFIDTELKFYLKKYNYNQIKINYKSPNKTVPIKVILDSVKVLFYLFFKKILNNKS
jgi:hypothetical protein